MSQRRKRPSERLVPIPGISRREGRPHPDALERLADDTKRLAEEILADNKRKRRIIGLPDVNFYLPRGFGETEIEIGDGHLYLRRAGKTLYIGWLDQDGRILTIGEQDYFCGREELIEVVITGVLIPQRKLDGEVIQAELGRLGIFDLGKIKKNKKVREFLKK